MKHFFLPILIIPILILILYCASNSSRVTKREKEGLSITTDIPIVPTIPPVPTDISIPQQYVVTNTTTSGGIGVGGIGVIFLFIVIIIVVIYFKTRV